MKLSRAARKPKPDVTLMILPPPASSMCGIAAREQCIAPVRFVSRPTRHSSSAMSVSVLPIPAVAPPALLTRISICPYSDIADSIIVLTELESVTSQEIQRAAPPPSRTRSAVSMSCASVRAVRTRSAPAPASASAIARPRPRPAPVTTATLPLSFSLSRTDIGPPAPGVRDVADDPAYGYAFSPATARTTASASSATT